MSILYTYYVIRSYNIILYDIIWTHSQLLCTGSLRRGLPGAEFPKEPPMLVSFDPFA